MRRIVALAASCLIAGSLYCVPVSANAAEVSSVVPLPSATQELAHYKSMMPKLRTEKVYIVKKGQSLSSISEIVYGSAEYWPALYYANHIRNANEIFVDHKLRIPPKPRHIPRLPFIKTISTVAHVTTPVNTQPAPVNPGPLPPVGGFEACVIERESGGDPTAYNTSSGASGLFGMLLSTWDSLGLGYPGGASTAPVSVQDQGFNILYARDGTSPWAPYDGC